MILQFEKLHKIKRQTPKEGDIFVIDLIKRSSHAYKPDNESFMNKEGKYGFGRIINIRASTGVIVENFNYVGKFTDNIDFIIEQGRMFNPINVTSLCFTSSRWKIIKSDNDFNKQSVGFDEIKLVMGIAPDLSLWKGGVTTPLTEKEANGIERFVTYFPNNVEERIFENFKSNISIVERWTTIESITRQIIEKETKESPQSFNQIINYLNSKNLFSVSEYKNFEELSMARNQIIHASASLSESQSKDLINIADNLIDKLEKTKDKAYSNT
jgi:hypothetical protein